MSAMRVIQNGRGTSLIELMVAALVFSLVAIFGMRFLILQHQLAVYQEDTVESQQQARAALDLMTREITLLGFGVPEGEPRLLMATEQEIEFLANLDAAIARLDQDAAIGETQLSINYINNSDKFYEGKTVSICTLDRCEWNTLAKDGGRNTLELDGGLRSSFPMGSTIQLIKRIQYALKAADPGPFNLYRTVDNGRPSPVAEGVASMKLEYLDWAGRSVIALPEIERVKIQLSTRMPRIPENIRSLVSEVYLRNGA